MKSSVGRSSLVVRRLITATIVALGLVALLLRLWGVGWSLPYVDHPDEPAVVNVVLRIVEGRLDPQFFFYPSLMLYLQALLLKVHFVLGLRTGLYQAPLQLPPTTDFLTSIPRAFVWARSLTALLSTATVVVIAQGARRFAGWRAALLAGALLAFAPWAVTHAHFITVDAPAALFATAAVLAAAQVYERGVWRDYLVAGLLAGLATATKYQAALVALPLIVAHLLRWRGQVLARGGRLVVAGLIAAAVFFITSPYILLDFPAFSRDIRTLVSSYNGAHGDITGRWPILQYLGFLWRDGLGPIPALFSLAGLWALGRRRPALLAVLLAFPLALLVVSLQAQTHFWRNLLPLQPPLLLIAAVGAVAVWDLLRRYIARPLRPAAAALLFLSAAGPSLVGALDGDAGLARPDSRIAAQEVIRRRWPGVRVATELSHPLNWSGLTQSTPVQYLPLHPLAWYRQQGFGLLLASSDARRSYDWTPDYRPLLDGSSIVATYGRPGDGYRGPQIDLIETGLSPATIPSHTPQARLGSLDLLGATTGRLQEKTTGPEVILGRTFKVGAVLSLTAFWTARSPMASASYTIFLHLRDAEGRNLAQRDAPPWNGLFPPSSWPPNQLVADRLDLPLPANLPPGAYHLVMGLYDSATQQRFPVTTNGTRLPNDEIDLGEIEIMR